MFGDVRVTVTRVDSRSDANWRWDLVDEYGLVEAQSTDSHNTADSGMYVSVRRPSPVDWPHLSGVTGLNDATPSTRGRTTAKRASVGSTCR